MLRILVLDDEALVQMALAQLLQDAGHAVLQGRSNELIALDLADAVYDLVITDINMPVMTGWDVARWVRQHRPRTPVFAVSGRMASDLDPVWVNQFDAVFTKPVDEAKLLQAIAGRFPEAAPSNTVA